MAAEICPKQPCNTTDSPRSVVSLEPFKSDCARAINSTVTNIYSSKDFKRTTCRVWSDFECCVRCPWDSQELEFYRTAGPVEWAETNDGYQWKWRQPANTFWDERWDSYQKRNKKRNLPHEFGFAMHQLPEAFDTFGLFPNSRVCSSGEESTFKSRKVWIQI